MLTALSNGHDSNVTIDHVDFKASSCVYGVYGAPYNDYFDSKEILVHCQ